MLETLNAIDSFVWGPPLLVLLVGTGIMLTIRLGLLQVLKLPQALKLIFCAKNDGHGDVNSFKALCTALAATVGTGNIVGVATAIKAGGPGALFWMWLAAFFGMAVIYFLTTLGILIAFADQVPAAVALVIESAFTTTAAQGGFLGATVMLAMRSGVARGVFSNESGLGSAPIVAAAAKTNWPAEQGLVSMTGTFIDTIIICTMTGLSLIVTGVWNGELNGAAMTNAAFTSAFPAFGSWLLLVGLVLFAFTTILGWNYYGERCVEYLMGVKAILPYRIGFIILVACGPFLRLEEIWVMSDIVNGLMALPNLIALVALSGVVVAETKAYQQHLKEEAELVPVKLAEETNH